MKVQPYTYTPNSLQLHRMENQAASAYVSSNGYAAEKANSKSQDVADLNYFNKDKQLDKNPNVAVDYHNPLEEFAAGLGVPHLDPSNFSRLSTALQCTALLALFSAFIIYVESYGTFYWSLYPAGTGHAGLFYVCPQNLLTTVDKCYNVAQDCAYTNNSGLTVTLPDCSAFNLIRAAALAALGVSLIGTILASIGLCVRSKIPRVLAVPFFLAAGKHFSPFVAFIRRHIWCDASPY